MKIKTNTVIEPLYNIGDIVYHRCNEMAKGMVLAIMVEGNGMVSYRIGAGGSWHWQYEIELTSVPKWDLPEENN